MHHAIAAWLTERPGRAAPAAAICSVLSILLFTVLIVVAAAIPVLVALRGGHQRAWQTAIVAFAAGALVVVVLGQAVLWQIVGLTMLIFGPLLLGLLLRRSGSLNLCYQLTVAVAAGAVVLIHVVLPDPAGVWEGLVRQVLGSMQQTGFPIEDMETVVRVWAASMWGALADMVMVPVLGALFLGSWWHTLLESPGSFGTEYRRLHLGRALGVVMTGLIAAAFMVDSALIASLSWVAFAALAFQGLAAAHRSKAGGGLTRGWLTAIYVLLIVPLSMSVTMVALAMWGLVDNWLRPRTQAA